MAAASKAARYIEEQHSFEKVIFLDVDGVLHPATVRTELRMFDEGCMKQLKSLLEETQAEIVLSSTWR